MDSYIQQKEIGSGAFGKVFLVESKSNGIQYVIKKININKISYKEKEKRMKEVEVLSKLNHPNIVTYKECYFQRDTLNIVMEFCHKGDLHSRVKETIEQHRVLETVDIINYFIQITRALEYIHKRRILHRDLKTKNIFITRADQLKLGDFGIAKVLQNSLELAQTCIGSPYYLSPEICQNKPYNNKSDIWALGCVLYELCALKYTFTATNMRTLLTKITKGVYNPLPSRIDGELRTLVAMLLRPNPRDRPTATNILDISFLKKFQTKTYTKRSMSATPYNGKFNNEKLNVVISQNSFRLNDNLSKITNPEMKYKKQLLVTKNLKIKKIVLKHNEKLKETETQTDFKPEFPPNSFLVPVRPVVPVKAVVVQRKNKINLPKVDSEYYNLIKATQQNERGEKRQERLETTNYTTDAKIRERSENKSQWNPEEDLLDIFTETRFLEELNSPHRKQWEINTCARNELINKLHDIDLLDASQTLIPQEETTNACMENTYLKKDKDKLLVRDETFNLPNKPMDENEPWVDADELEKFFKTRTVTGNNNKNINCGNINKTTTQHDMDKTLNRTYSLPDLQTCAGPKTRLGSTWALDEENNLINYKIDTETVFSNLERKRITLENNIGIGQFLAIYKRLEKLFESGVQHKHIANSQQSLNLIGSEKNLCGEKQEADIKAVWELVVADHIYNQQQN